MSEDNGTAPQPQQGQVQLNIQVAPQGVMLNCSYPVTLGLPAETMDALAEQWIMQRPALLQKIAQKAVTARKQELAIIRHVNSHRND
jgi:ABC-type sulfate transport system substrate-binding protein